MKNRMTGTPCPVAGGASVLDDVLAATELVVGAAVLDVPTAALELSPELHPARTTLETTTRAQRRRCIRGLWHRRGTRRARRCSRADVDRFRPRWEGLGS